MRSNAPGAGAVAKKDVKKDFKICRPGGFARAVLEETNRGIGGSMTEETNVAGLEERIRRIEDRLGPEAGGARAGFRTIHPLIPFGLGIAAVVLGYLGMGLPRHFYQILFSGLLILLLYHRGILRPARGPWQWPQIALNFLILCLLFKLLIGGGVAHPFSWFKLPVLAKLPHEAGQAWLSRVVPDYAVRWQAVPALADWSVDVTRIQTLLFVVLFAGALFRFEPFTSIMALGLLCISLPDYLHYDWDRIILFLVGGGVSLYLQAPSPQRPLRERTGKS
jgi:hypothetical protein